MARKLSNKKIMMGIVGVMIASIMLQAMNVMSLLLHGVAEQYPDASEQTIAYIMTVLNIGGIIGMIAAGKTAQYLTKKTILVSLMIIMGVGGLIGYFSFNLPMIFIAAILIGIADGSFIPITGSMIAELLTGSKRAWAMGIQGLFVNGGGVLLNIVGGFLAATYWKNLYFLYFAAFPIGLLLAILLPNGGEKESQNKAQSEKAPLFTKFENGFILQGFAVGVGFMTVMANATFFVFGAGLGNEVQAGMITAGATAGALTLGAIFIVPEMRLLKRYHWAISLTLGTAGLFILAMSHSLIPAIIGGFLVGSCFSMCNTAFYSVAPMNIHPARTSIGMSLYTAAMNVGMMFATAVLIGVAAAFGPEISYRFIAAGILVGVVTICAYIFPTTLYKGCKLTLQDADAQEEAEENQLKQFEHDEN